MLGQAVAIHTIDRLDPQLEWVEDGTSFAANARIKALAVHHRLQQLGLAEKSWVLADDSGLAVEALGGAPGIHSARYAGPTASDKDNNQKLIRELSALSSQQASPRFAASFHCTLCFVDERGQLSLHEGRLDGEVSLHGQGAHGFGYDPLFVVAEQGGRTLAEIPAAQKNQISHRHRAVAEWLGYLQRRKNQRV